ncbi:MAG: cache domain-containing protein, partial [Myxococcales bacterium]|nr:cache domain-containing protein [Myxococcales bacterium]
MARSSFRTKLVLVAGVSVAAGLLLSGGAAYVGIQRLGADAAEETQRGLRYASTEYLDKHIDNVAQHLSIELDRAEAELATFAAIQQQIIDHQEELQPVLDAAAKAPMLKDNLVFDPKGQWSQTGDAEPTTVTAWGYLHEPPEAEGEARAIREDVAQAIDDTALMDLLMPAIGRHGSRKLQIYYVGPKERAFARFFPAVPLAQTLDEKDPGHNGEVFWDHFFPSLVEGWTSWVGHKERFEDLARQITFLSPYDDAAGGGPIITLFQPLWSADRTRFAGALGFDLTLTGIIDYVEEVKLFESGFAFLAQDNGNVFAISERGSRTLGLSTTSSEGGGVSRYDQFLGKSSEAAIRDLKLPEGEAAESREIVLGGHNYVLELKRLAPFNVWGGTDEITEARWVV